MLNAHQIVSMTDAQMDEFLKSILVQYLEEKQGMNSLQILNALLKFRTGSGDHRKSRQRPQKSHFEPCPPSIDKN